MNGNRSAAIWWIRRDLRLVDNRSLAGARAESGRVIPVFVLDPRVLGSRYHARAETRKQFLFSGLVALDGSLRARGSRLIVREGSPAEVLAALAQETGAQSVWAEEDPSPYARARDRAVAAQVPLQLTGGLTVQPPAQVCKADGTPYTVFTPFSRMWKTLPPPDMRALIPAPERLAPLSEIKSVPLPPAHAHPLFPAGEAEAHRRLAAFVESRLARYGTDRDRMDLDGTSSLSPYLHLGMLSARQAYAAANQVAQEPDARRGAEVWVNELIWREFYISVLYHFPNVLRKAFRTELRGISWENDAHAFEAWKQGCTGYPVVDAAMRQLRDMGWIHNRARMIAASFLVKDLLVDWRRGEQWFMERLIDGDPAANNGGWQWTAGVGTDAAPYFRVFNPTLQGARFDLQGAYVRHWVPELARVPDKFIHRPWEMPEDMQREAGCVIGRDYAGPIIEHYAARERALAAYRR